MGFLLKNPPLAEAICEFVFDSTSWDWAIPGQLYEKVKGDFPEKSEIKGFDIEIKMDGSAPENKVNAAPDRIQFKNTETNILIQVGPRGLTVNKLKPYTTWDEYKAVVFDIYGKFLQLIENPKIERIGLRYINPLFPGDINHINEVLKIFPNWPSTLEKDLVGFHQRYELIYEKEKDFIDGVLVHQTGVVKSKDKKNSLGLMLDLDFIVTSIESHECKYISELIEKAHEIVELTFVESLNSEYFKKLREGI